MAKRPVIDANGTVVEMEERDIPFARGYRELTPEETAQRSVQASVEGDPLAKAGAFSAAALGDATFGVSDLALGTATGDLEEWQQGRAGLAKALPGYDAAGSVFGTVAPALL